MKFTTTKILHTLVTFSCLLAVACPSGDGDGDGDGDKEPFECELGVLDEAGVFVPAATDARAELELGFQGFLFVEVRVRAEGDVPSLVEASSRITLEGEDPSGAKTPSVGMDVLDGAYMSEPLLLFFNSATPADLAGRVAAVVVKVESDTHECTAEGSLLLVDDDPCIHTGDEPICPDDPDQGEGPER